MKGFKRRFWQGNNTHRGTEQRLGRVVTLIEDENEVTWGKAFRLDDEQASRTYLDTREVQLGGYTTILTEFMPLDENVEPFPVLIYIALESNDQYLGKASYPSMALDIISSKGQAGHNLEYLAKLAQFMRENLMSVQDDHLYLLEQLCIFMLKRMNSSLLNYFYCHAVDEKWLKRIQIEWINSPAMQVLFANDLTVKRQPYLLKKAHSLENTSSPELSDEESDSSETGPCTCSNQDGCCGLGDLFDSTLLYNDLLMNGDCLYLAGKPFLITPRSSQDDAILDFGLTKEQYRRKKNSFSGFDSHSRKWSIKGY